MNALYYATTVSTAAPSLADVMMGLTLGLGASLVAGWWPAREAARTPPAQILVRHVGAAAGPAVLRFAWLGFALIALGVVAAQLPPLRFAGGARFPLAGYAAAFLWIFGGGILAGFLLPRFAAVASGSRERFATARVALSHLLVPSGRHRLAVAALLCAIGMTAGMVEAAEAVEVRLEAGVQHVGREQLE